MSDGDGDRILTDLNRRWRRAYYKKGEDPKDDVT